MPSRRGPTQRGESAKSASAIPLPTVRRLSLYLRQLENLWRAEQHTVSSRQLGEALRLTDTQIRKDLAYFGQFGHPGIGYDVGELTSTIRHILGTDRTWNVLLVGAGNLGSALSAYRGFARKGFKLVAVCDVDARKVGKPMPSNPELIVQPLSDVVKIVRQKDIRLAINAVPAEAAQEVASLLAGAGIQGLFNFAPVNLDLAPQVAVSTIDLAVQLEQLSFRVGMRKSVGESRDEMNHEV
jgi:redox-sensing transcriptional repressor